jgi:uncharacterized protein
LKFTQDSISTVSVRRLERGEITVGEDVIRDNLVLHHDLVEPGWPVSDIASLVFEDLEQFLRPQTEIVLLGTGWNILMPSRDLVFALARKGIGFEFMDTPAACRTFNILVGEGREVTAFLIVRAEN